MTKPSMNPSGFPENDKDLVQVIDRTALIENILNQIIVGYCAPRSDAFWFMWSIVLDTSVMQLGAKLKVVLAIAHEMRFKLNEEALRSVISLRNAFAHHATNAYPGYVVGREPEEGYGYLELWVLNSSGKISRMKRNGALAAFNRDYTSAKESVAKLKDAVRTRYEQPPM